MKKYVISDIHGCCDTFKQLLTKIDIKKEDELYLLGDYIDRGPDSKGVIDHILHLQENDYKVHCLIGNHEMMLLDAYNQRTDEFNWLFNGGHQALESWGVSTIDQIPEKYIDFMNNLAFYLTVDDYLLVHAGFNFRFAKKYEDIFNDKDAMVWIRYWYDDIKYDLLGKYQIIHGHTPIEKDYIESQKAPQYPINIDAGCVYYPRAGLGHLCAFDVTEKKIIFQENIEHQTVA